MSAKLKRHTFARPVVSNDYWPAKQFTVTITQDGVSGPPAIPLASVSCQLKSGRTGELLGPLLSTDTTGAAIVDADNWIFTLGGITLTDMPAGVWYGQVECYNTSGHRHTYFEVALTILPD